ncbi:MAG: Wzz/FepE/Etk N-terminal domain-containing protein [Fluviibacter phosphoraccumulans]
MNQEVNNIPADADEVNVWELLEHIKSGWRWIAGGAVLGLVGAVGFVLTVSPKYEATALVQSAKVVGNEVETTGQLLERLKFPTFYNDEVVNACGLENATNPGSSLALAVKPVIVKGSTLIQLSYRADSPTEAKACLDAVLKRAPNASVAC